MALVEYEIDLRYLQPALDGIEAKFAEHNRRIDELVWAKRFRLPLWRVALDMLLLR